MSRLTPTQGCCGLYELYQLGESSKDTLNDFIELFDQNFSGRGPLAFALFSDNEGSGRGKRLAEYITKYKLGTMEISAAKENKKSRRLLRVFIWSIDWEALRSWWVDIQD